MVNAEGAAAQPASSVSPCVPSTDTQGTSFVQTFVGQGSTLEVEIASLKKALGNAVNTIASLNLKVHELNTSVNELTSKLDENVIDASADRLRIDTLEQNQRVQDQEEDWWTQGAEAEALQGDHGAVKTRGANDLQHEGSLLNVRVHTPEPDEREDEVAREPHLPAQPQAPGLLDGLHLSRPPALADFPEAGQAAPCGRGTYPTTPTGALSYSFMGLATGAMPRNDSSHDAEAARSELFRRMAGGSLMSPAPTSPTSLAPQGTFAQDSRADGLSQQLPPGLCQLLRVDPLSGQQVGGPSVVHGTAGGNGRVPSFGSTGGGFGSQCAQGLPSSFGPSASAGVPARESGERPYFDNTGGFAGRNFSARPKDDLDIPLDDAAQNNLMKQCSFLQELPTLNSVEQNASKAERLREWRYKVEQKLASLHPVFQDYWDWSWQVADAFYQHWLSLDAPSRAALCVSAPVPPRYRWVENFFKDKVVATLPQRLQQEHRGEHRAGNRTAVHGLLCELLKLHQPGGMSEKQEVETKLRSPNICSDAGAALREVRAWQSATRRAWELGMQLPEAGFLFAAATSIYKNIFESAQCSSFLHAKWVNKWNSIDPAMGNKVDYDDVISMNTFAYGELQQIHLSGGSSSATGLPLTQAELRRKKETEVKEKEKKAAEKANWVTDKFNKNPAGGNRPAHVEGAGGKKGGGKAKSISTTTSSWAGPCTFWHSAKGECTRGVGCKFKHTGFPMFDSSGTMVKRCVTCGSSAHTHKECTRPGGGADPEHDKHWEEYRKRKAEQAQQQPQQPGEKGGDKGKGKGGRKGKGKGKGKGGGKVNAATESAPGESSTQPPPPAPVTPQPRAVASKVAVRKLTYVDNVPHEGALLDSGATACVQYVDQLDSKEKVVPVYLASGSSLPCGRTVSAKGMPIVHMVGKQSTSILPLLWLIERHCTLTTDWTQLITPKGRRLHIIVADNLPWIGKQAVKDLMHDLPAAEEMGRSGRRASTNINVIFSLRVRCAAVTMKPQAPKALEDEAQGVDTAFEDQAQLDSRRRGSHVDARASETAASGICENLSLAPLTFWLKHQRKFQSHLHLQLQ